MGIRTCTGFKWTKERTEESNSSVPQWRLFSM